MILYKIVLPHTVNNIMIMSTTKPNKCDWIQNNASTHIQFYDFEGPQLTVGVYHQFEILTFNLITSGKKFIRNSCQKHAVWSSYNWLKSSVWKPCFVKFDLKYWFINIPVLLMFKWYQNDMLHAIHNYWLWKLDSTDNMEFLYFSV